MWLFSRHLLSAKSTHWKAQFKNMIWACYQFPVWKEKQTNGYAETNQTTMQSCFQNGRTTQLKTIWKNNINVNSANFYRYSTMSKNLERSCKEKYIVIGSQTVLRYYMATSDTCELILASDRFYMMHFAFGGYKGFPYVDAFSTR